jgi:hypothetical protein
MAMGIAQHRTAPGDKTMGNLRRSGAFRRMWCNTDKSLTAFYRESILNLV